MRRSESVPKVAIVPQVYASASRRSVLRPSSWNRVSCRSGGRPQSSVERAPRRLAGRCLDSRAPASTSRSTAAAVSSTSNAMRIAVARPAVRLDPVDHGDLTRRSTTRGSPLPPPGSRRARRPRPRTPPAARQPEVVAVEPERRVEFVRVHDNAQLPHRSTAARTHRGRRGDRARAACAQGRCGPAPSRAHASRAASTAPPYAAPATSACRRSAPPRRRRSDDRAGDPRTDAGMPRARVRRPVPSPRRSRGPARGCPGRSRARSRRRGADVGRGIRRLVLVTGACSNANDPLVQPRPQDVALRGEIIEEARPAHSRALCDRRRSRSPRSPARGTVRKRLRPASRATRREVGRCANLRSCFTAYGSGVLLDAIHKRICARGHRLCSIS